MEVAPNRRTIDLINTLLHLGLVPFMLSCVGRSAEYKWQAERFRELIAQDCNFPIQENPDAPRKGAFHLRFSDRTGFPNQYPAARREGRLYGKAWWCTYYGCHIMVDDRANILYECESVGIVCYQIRRRNSGFPEYVPRRAYRVYWEDARRRQPGNFVPHLICEGQGIFINYIRSEVHSGALAWKIQAACEHRLA